jgi:uncharacterized protein involved in exopolysaccharide biosynthesis
MMQRYLETFFRHRKALLAPIALAIAISVAFVAVQPRTYQAKAQLWFNSTAVLGESSPADANRTPAQVGQSTFQELLQTRNFTTSVGHNGPLASYMQNGHMPSYGPLGPIDELRGNSSVTAQEKLDDAMEKLLQKQVHTSVSGPQIVTITFDYTNANVAQGTLQELTKEFSDQVLQAQRVRNQQGVNQLNQQVTYYQQQATANDAALAQYASAHPGAGASDTTYAGLQRAADQSHQQLSSATQQRDQAQVKQNQLDKGAVLDFRVIDPASIPDGVQGFATTLLSGAAAGLAIGLLISFLALVALVLADRTLWTPGDVEQALGLKVVGVVPLLPARRKASGRRGLGPDRPSPMLGPPA